MNYATRAKELNTPPPPIPRLLTTPLAALTGDRETLDEIEDSRRRYDAR
ncbi:MULTISPECIES: hypothetical protein [unclassified Streptomyces]|nr:hypothetical protein OIE76_00410 [Streptomyces sp. NBC_01727]